MALGAGEEYVGGFIRDADKRLVVNVGAGVTEGLTDAELRADPVEVEGPLTDAELRASAVPISGTVSSNSTEVRPSSAAVTQVASSATNVTLASSNSSRRGLTIYNDSTQAVFVKFGTTASSTSFTVKMAAATYYEVPNPCYTGRIDAIWVSANGNAYVTEIT